MAVSTTTAISRVGGDTATLPLENGDRLTRAEFERRYAAMPRLKKAELIEGIVYVPSPVRYSPAWFPACPSDRMADSVCSTHARRRRSR